MGVRWRWDRVRPLRTPVVASLDLVVEAEATSLAVLRTVAVAFARSLGADEDSVEAVAVAALMAGEHAVRLLELLLPGGARRSADLAGAVRLAALDRIAAVRGDLEEARP